MNNPFKPSSRTTPLLSPIAPRGGWRQRARDTVERLPPAAAPIAFTLAGGVGLVAIVASILAGSPDETPFVPDARLAAEDAVAANRPDEAGQQAEATTDSTDETDAIEEIAPPADETSTARAAIAPSPAIDAPVVPPDSAGDASANGEWTASIPPALPGGGTFAPAVEIAETPEEIEALEAIQRVEVEEDVGAPSPEETAAIPPAADPRVPATTTKWVNMRAGPSDDAEVLEVVPALAAVDAQAGCDWCQVSYEGREGFIYKTFLSYGDGEE